MFHIYSILCKCNICAWFVTSLHDRTVHQPQFFISFKTHLVLFAFYTTSHVCPLWPFCFFLHQCYYLFPQTWKWRWRPPWRAAWPPEPAPHANLSSPCLSTSPRSIRKIHRSRATRRCLWSTGRSSRPTSGRERSLERSFRFNISKWPHRS